MFEFCSSLRWCLCRVLVVCVCFCSCVGVVFLLGLCSCSSLFVGVWCTSFVCAFVWVFESVFLYL